MYTASIPFKFKKSHKENNPTKRNKLSQLEKKNTTLANKKLINFLIGATTTIIINYINSK